MIKLLWISFLPSLSEDVIPSPLEDTVLGSFSHYVCLFCVFLSFKGDIDSKNRRKKKKEEEKKEEKRRRKKKKNEEERRRTKKKEDNDNEKVFPLKSIASHSR